MLDIQLCYFTVYEYLNDHLRLFQYEIDELLVSVIEKKQLTQGVYVN